MRARLLLMSFFSAAFLIANYSHADARLEKQLELAPQQASTVQQIQKTHRKQFRAKRQQLHKELRALRRARIAHDDTTAARQEKITAALEQELRQIRSGENDRIRAVLTPAQRDRFETIIRQRRASVGSSRDAKIF